MDEDIIVPGLAVKKDKTQQIEMNSSEKEVTEFQNTTVEILVSKYPKRSKASACRELINEIKSLTFSIYEVEVLDTLEKELITLKDMLCKHTLQDEGLIIENPHNKQKLRWPT